MENLSLVATAAAVFALLYAFYYTQQVGKADRGNAKMVEISDAIRVGALAFLSREYKVLAIFMGLVAILLAIAIHPLTALNYIAGASLSALAGYIGLNIATKANSRTTQAATKGVGQALEIAFRGGTVMGFSVVGLGLFGISISYLLFHNMETTWMGHAVDPFNIINGFALGASTMALFARVGGGIYTKAADVGADLVGKVEQHIPEDDPRNPAVIADNVGDNVGDVAGMGADLYESYVGSIIAPMTLAIILQDQLGFGGIVLPFLIAAAGILCSVIGTFVVKTSEGGHLHTALTKGTYVAAALTTVAAFALVNWLLPGKIMFAVSILGGLLAGVAIGLITEYYTSYAYKPVKTIAENSQTGPATNVLAGISVGMMSTVFPVVSVCVGIIVAYMAGEAAIPNGGGIYGIALAGLGMLATTGIVIGVDAYGPIADNAGGISEMAELGPEVRKITDSLDAVGNTTAAIAKGFAIGSAALTALGLFTAFSQAIQVGTGEALVIDILYWKVIVGLFLGGMLVFLFSSLAIQAVSRAAFDMVNEVRRQFREITGLMEGTAKPDYARCVDISTAGALKQMMLPGIITVLAPIFVGLVLGVEALGGLLAGALVCGFLMAVFMANAGGAWDNAKKYVELGNLGGKGTPTHAAAVSGDTVGDPFKDTAGPSLNILIKLMTVISLVFAPIFGASLL